MLFDFLRKALSTVTVWKVSKYRPEKFPYLDLFTPWVFQIWNKICSRSEKKSEVLWRIKMSTISMSLTISWRRPLSYRNQSIYLQSKSMDWFLYDNGLGHERVKPFQPSVAFHIETNHLIRSVNQMTGFYMKCNTWLIRVKQ